MTFGHETGIGVRPVERSGSAIDARMRNEPFGSFGSGAPAAAVKGCAEHFATSNSRQDNREDQIETLRRTIGKVLLLADRDKGTTAMLVFAGTEDEVRRVDELYDRMNPSEGGGRRQSVDVYEVAIDEEIAR